MTSPQDWTTRPWWAKDEDRVEARRRRRFNSWVDLVGALLIIGVLARVLRRMLK